MDLRPHFKEGQTILWLWPMEGFFSSSSSQLWKYIVTFMMRLFANLHTIKGCTVGFSKVLQRFTSFPCSVRFRCHCWLKRYLLSSWYVVYFKTETNTFHTHMQPKKATTLSDNPINPSCAPRYVLSQTGNCYFWILPAGCHSGYLCISDLADFYARRPYSWNPKGICVSHWSTSNLSCVMC